MTTLLLVVIYIAFISLGLPDSILGSAWPSMYGGLNVPIAYAGIVSMIISGGTIIASFFSDRVIAKLGTGLVTAISVFLTAAALLGFGFSTSFWMLCAWAVPYGLGAGSVDAALNNFVALHYKSRHMSWLHCFWGVGASIGPYIMGICLTGGHGWNRGYDIIGWMQIVLVAVLFLSLPLWKKKSEAFEKKEMVLLSKKEALALPRAKSVLIAFFCYCSLETTAGLWAGSYMVLHRGINAETAAKWVSMFYLGITLGRFLCGFITDRLGDKKMVLLGQGIIAMGLVVLFLPLPGKAVMAGLCIMGLGCAPIYPSMIHATPTLFGAESSQSLMGMQMACAYVGSTFMPPVFGLIAGNISAGFFPLFLLVFEVGMIISARWLFKDEG